MRGIHVHVIFSLIIDLGISYIICIILLKALPPVCMKYTARDRGESRVANIA